MKQFLLGILLLVGCLALPVSFIKSNAEVAPRGEVLFSYSPSQFSPAPLSLTYSVGRQVYPSGSGFIISGTDPVLVNNGVFTLAVQSSGSLAVQVGSDIMALEPSLRFGGDVWSANASTVQVFPGTTMTYVLWRPFNTTVSGYRIARVWRDKPWLQLETVLSSDEEVLVDLSDLVTGLNVGSTSADTVKMLLKDSMYEGPVFSSEVIPTEGWMLAYDGEAGMGVSLDSDYWDLGASGNDITILSHKSLALEPDVQQSVSSFFQVMGPSLDFRSAQSRYWGGWRYRFNTSSDWTSETVGQVDDQSRDENATFLLPQPAINASLASISFDVTGIVGSSPSLQCSVNGHLIFEEPVESVGEISREIPVRWLEWGSNTLSCYADGGDVVISDVFLSLCSVEGMRWVHAGDEWRYASLAVSTNTTGVMGIDVDMRDLGITRDYPTVIVLDSTLSRIGSSYEYPVLSFNASLVANITNSLFIAFGDGQDLVLAGPSVAGSAGNYSAYVVEIGGFGPASILRSMHREGRISKRTPTSETGSAQSLVYSDGAGALFTLAVWK